MAIITSLYGSSSVSKLIRDTDCDTSIELNINGGAANVQQVFIDITVAADQRFETFADGAAGVSQQLFQRVDTGLLDRPELHIL